MAHGDITHIDIPVDDIARAQSFYSSLFGWQIAEVPGYEGYPMWQAPNKISGGGLAPRDEGLQSPRSYVEVDSIDDVMAKATELGAQVVLAKTPISETSWYAAFKDTEGNVMGLYEGTTDVGPTP
jgi:predicted enzyme related to lactoylglutathione lyase